MLRVVKEIMVLLLVSGLAALGIGVAQGLPQTEKGEAQELCEAPTGEASSGEEHAIQWVSQDEAQILHEQGGAVFVDARPESEYAQGHILGAIHLGPDVNPLPDLVLKHLKEFSVVVTYCDTKGGCGLSTQLAKRLSVQGVTGIRILEGGIVDWVSNGFAAEAGTCRTCPSDK